MSIKRLLFLFLAIFVLVGCVSKSREKELLNIISKLEGTVEEYENGAEKIHADRKSVV